MAKKIVNSKRFPDITFELYEKINEEGNILYIVRHTDLMDAILNRIPKGYNCKYDFDKVQILGNMHFLVKVLLEDNETRIVEHGEVCPSTLTTQIAKEYPATMAMNRAFDRAAIRYFNLEKKVYSDNEINLSSMKDTPESSANSAVAATSSQTQTKTAATAASANNKPGFAEVDSSVSAKNAPKPKFEQASTQASSKEMERLTKLSTLKVGLLKYADLTLEECFNKDKNNLIWIAQKVTSGVNIEKADLIREFLTLKNVSY